MVVRYHELVRHEAPHLPASQAKRLRQTVDHAGMELGGAMIGVLDAWLRDSDPANSELADSVAAMPFAQRVALLDHAERGLSLRHIGRPRTHPTSPLALHLYPDEWHALQSRTGASRSQVLRRAIVRYAEVCRRELPSGPWVEDAVLLVTHLTLPLEPADAVASLDRTLASAGCSSLLSEIRPLRFAQRLAIVDAAERRVA